MIHSRAPSRRGSLLISGNFEEIGMKLEEKCIQNSSQSSMVNQQIIYDMALQEGQSRDANLM
jgi:hypothetical protein